MSDSSTIKKPPFSLPNVQAEQVIAFARTPLAIAILASLGVHGLLWLGLPYLTAAEPKKDDAQKAVDVIELSPLEQARLPQSALDQALNPRSKTPKADNKTTASATNVPANPGDPTINDSVPYYSVPDLLGSATSGYSGTYGGGSYGSSTYDSRTYGSSTYDSRTERTQEQSDPPRKSTKPTPKTTESKAEDSKKTEQQADSSKTETTDKQTSDDSEKISKQAKDLQGDGGAATSDTSQQELVALREKYAYNPDDPGLGQNAALESITKFSAENGIDINDWSKVKEVEVLLPEDACKVKTDLGAALKQPLSMGAIVQPDGSLSKVVLFGSSGSKGLNQLAVDHLKKQEFPPGDQSNFLRFRVKFDPDNAKCMATSADSSPS